MKNSKRILALLLCTLIVLALVPALSAYAESYSGTCGENLTWNFDASTGVLTISGTGNMYNFFSDDNPWYQYNFDITSAIIENGVTSIGSFAFRECVNLSSVTIPDSVTIIADYAFFFCSSLTNIIIPDGVKVIDMGTFEECGELTSITIPKSITGIAFCAFECCTALKDVYYTGNEAEWRNITVVEGNDPLTNATIHYNSASVNTSSTNEINVTLNGESITFDQEPTIIDGRTMVPLRAIFEALGASVDWDNTTQTVTAEKNGIIVKMTIGQPTMYVNGSPVTLDVAPQLVNSRTLVPARAVAESFNCNVDWNNDTRTVIITY